MSHYIPNNPEVLFEASPREDFPREEWGVLPIALMVADGETVAPDLGVEPEPQLAPVGTLYPPEVLQKADLIYVISQQYGVDTHILGLYLYIYQDRLSAITMNELNQLAEYVSRYAQKGLAEGSTRHLELDGLVLFINEVILGQPTMDAAKWAGPWQSLVALYEKSRTTLPITPQVLLMEEELKLQLQAEAAQVAAQQALQAQKPKYPWQ